MTSPLYIFFWPILCLFFLAKVSLLNHHYHSRVVFIEQEAAHYGGYTSKMQTSYFKHFGAPTITITQTMMVGLWIALCIGTSLYSLVDIAAHITFVEKRKGLMILAGEQHIVLAAVSFVTCAASIRFSLGLLSNFMKYSNFYMTAHVLRLNQMPSVKL